MTTDFRISNDTMVVTSLYVTQEGYTILEITHDDDEGGSLWQFHCGNGDYSMEKMQLVRLATILDIDPSVLDAAGLSKGELARRESKGDAWTVQSFLQG